MERKIILVKDDVKEINKLLLDGWVATQAFPHPKGALIVIQKQK